MVSWFHNKFNVWLKKRIPSSFEHHLSNRNVFIFPTAFGFSYLFVVTILFLLATNYQNNLIMLLSYLLASLFISAMLHSFFNLSGLHLIAHQQVTSYANSTVYLPIQLISDKPRFALTFCLKKQQSTFLPVIKSKDQNESNMEVLVPFFAVQRGVFSIPRLKVASEYSLGLFTCWTQLAFASQLVIYPQPKALRLSLAKQFFADNTHEVNINIGQGEDFYQLKSYQLGESLSQVSWKHVAKGQGWLSKTSQQPQEREQSLKLTDMPANNVEDKLSFLCYLVQEYCKQGVVFSLDLTINGQVNSKRGQIQIAANSGSEHAKCCLLALAEFKA